MLLFIAILARGFSFVGQCLEQGAMLQPQFRFLIWSLGASLFAHATTCISVSYFDQSVAFLYLTLAAVGSSRSDAIYEVKAKLGQRNNNATLAISIPHAIEFTR